MRRLQQFSFSPDVNTPDRRAATPAKPATAGTQPRDDMWRSQRVLSGSDWMEAWVRKPRS